MTGATPAFSAGSLYVGDISPDVTESMLYKIFNQVGQVASIRVCRDSVSRRSLGYAYVNYHSQADAEKALDSLNYTTIANNACRIMWSHRDPALRKSGEGNIFVKNLEKDIDNKALYDTFSMFGNVLSCKIATDEHGKSKGYGFVHYDEEDSARKAIEKVNGMQIGGKTIFAGKFVRNADRRSTKDEMFTNIYTKNFPNQWNEETLKVFFEKYGGVSSLVLRTDTKNRRFAFLNYDEPRSAKLAVDTLNGQWINLEGEIVDGPPGNVTAAAAAAAAAAGATTTTTSSVGAEWGAVWGLS
eukprot:GHVU01201705.1.p1 GENE.GHVU01201705.1~~GHVU01201705.1.p1  ORF type:complete len:299 (+),score=61.94 GHVU01201705.1:680-1576(+)